MTPSDQPRVTTAAKAVVRTVATNQARGAPMRDKRITARAFHDAVGVQDWRVLFSGAHAYFGVRSFAEGARFVAE